MKGKDMISRSLAALRSRQGHNLFVFSVFLIIAAFLWLVLALNDESQMDIRMPVRVNHLPDSVTLISPLPSSVTFGVHARGSQLLKYSLMRVPPFSIDYRLYRSGNSLRLSDADMKSIARQALGSASIIVVSPDSLNISFTSRPPVVLPVRLDCSVSVGPKVALSGKPVVYPDSVKLFTASNRPLGISEITTEPLVLSSLEESASVRVRLMPPAGCRVIPDSVTVSVEVEPLIFKTRRVAVEPVNVPDGMRLVTFPSAVDVMYMIPVSDYIDVEPRIRVVADYAALSPSSGKVRLRVAEASDLLRNVAVTTDSVEYILERVDR